MQARLKFLQCTVALCCAFCWLLKVRRKQIQALSLIDRACRISGHTQKSERFQNHTGEMNHFQYFDKMRWTSASVNVFCGSRSQIEAVVGWQNVSFCPFIHVISKLDPGHKGYSYSTRSQSHFTSSVSFNLDQLDSFWDCGIFQTSALIRFYYNHLKVMFKKW